MAVTTIQYRGINDATASRVTINKAIASPGRSLLQRSTRLEAVGGRLVAVVAVLFAAAPFRVSAVAPAIAATVVPSVANVAMPVVATIEALVAALIVAGAGFPEKDEEVGISTPPPVRAT
jgi:hypothetical protein